MSDNLIWVDLETTGLDERRGYILELAVVVTDGELNELESWDWVVTPPEGWRSFLHPEAAEMHFRNGLMLEVDKAYLDIDQVGQLLTTILEPYRGPPAAGSSVHCDRRWIAEKLPAVDDMFHYRNVDVSSVKELVRRWYPELGVPPALKRHRALDDILDSIDELRFYRENVFR